MVATNICMPKLAPAIKASKRAMLRQCRLMIFIFLPQLGPFFNAPLVTPSSRVYLISRHYPSQCERLDRAYCPLFSFRVISPCSVMVAVTIGLTPISGWTR